MYPRTSNLVFGDDQDTEESVPQYESLDQSVHSIVANGPPLRFTSHEMAEGEKLLAHLSSAMFPHKAAISMQLDRLQAEGAAAAHRAADAARDAVFKSSVDAVAAAGGSRTHVTGRSKGRQMPISSSASSLPRSVFSVSSLSISFLLLISASPPMFFWLSSPCLSRHGAVPLGHHSHLAPAHTALHSRPQPVAAIAAAPATVGSAGLTAAQRTRVAIARPAATSASSRRSVRRAGGEPKARKAATALATAAPHEAAATAAKGGSPAAAAAGRPVDFNFKVRHGTCCGRRRIIYGSCASACITRAQCVAKNLLLSGRGARPAGAWPGACLLGGALTAGCGLRKLLRCGLR